MSLSPPRNPKIGDVWVDSFLRDAKYLCWHLRALLADLDKTREALRQAPGPNRMQIPTNEEEAYRKWYDRIRAPALAPSPKAGEEAE